MKYILGINEENILIASNGNVIELSNNGIRIADTVQSGRVLVDGLGVGDVGSIVLRDRKHLAEDGIIIVSVAIDKVTREVVSGPEVVSRGFVYVKESEELMSEITELSCDILEKCYLSNIYDRNAIKGKLRDGVSRYLYEKTLCFYFGVDINFFLVCLQRLTIIRR